MKQNLFPKEIIENTQENNFSVHSLSSKLIYITIVLSVIGLICALPLIKVDVGVRGSGMIRPVTDVIQVFSPVNAKINSIQAVESSYVKKGDIIAVFDDSEIRERINFNKARRAELTVYIADIHLLQKHISNPSVVIADLNTERYKRAALEFGQQLLNHQHSIEQQKRNLRRDSLLFNRNAISLKQLEETEYALQSEKNNYQLIVEQQRNKWILDKTSFQKEINQLKSEHTQLSSEIRRYNVQSPVSGTLLNVNRISEESFIFSNQVITEISPDTSLIAEIYIPPKDIGLLREGLPVRFQIDAYDHNQWGTVSGRIENISSDMIVQENTPVFKVRCTIDTEYLELPNGFKGYIKKGLTLQARFIINRRSLFQLLYDNMDDWLNPAWPTTGDKTTPANS